MAYNRGSSKYLSEDVDKECDLAMTAAVHEHTHTRIPHSKKELKQCPLQPTMTSLTGNLGRAKKGPFNMALH